MLSIAICDDDPHMRHALKKLVGSFFAKNNMDISTMLFSSGEELLRQEDPIDILFLDIQMKKTDGMETAKRLRQSGFKGFLIFITVLKEMVFQAFAVQAFDYLLKPVQEDDFEKTMRRLLDCMENAKGKSLLVRIGYESRLVFFDDIVYCEVINRKIYLHLLSSEVVAYYEKIEDLEKKLDTSFYKCHRSFLIHLKYLKGYKNGTAFMEGGEEIPVSRLRGKEFSSVILRYMKDGKK